MERTAITTETEGRDAADPDSDGKAVTRARNSAYRFLSIRPRSRAEVERKLAGKEFSPGVIRTVLADLERLGYVNDRSFASQWAGSRVRLRGFGRRRIDQELREKSVSREIINETLAALFADSPEEDIARREAAKKMKSLQHLDPEVGRRRLAGHLERKGYSAQIISSVLRSWKAGDAGDQPE